MYKIGVVGDRESVLGFKAVGLDVFPCTEADEAKKIVRKIAKEGKLKAVVSTTIDDEFVIHDIKVIDGDKGLFIAMPSKKTGDGDYRDIAHPINSDTRGMLQRKILEAYNNASDEEV